MFLYEIFDANSIFEDDSNIKRIKEYLLDVVLPLAATHVPFVSVKEVIFKLNDLKTNLSIDRKLIMDLLNPDKIKIIKKIEGDRIYFNDPEAPLVSNDEDTEKNNKKKLAKMAMSQIKKEFKDK